MLNEDYRDMLQALVAEKARFLIITAASGLQFDRAFARSLTVEIEGIEVHIPSVADLIRNKRASGRTKDLADAEALERLDGPEPSVTGDAISQSPDRRK